VRDTTAFSEACRSGWTRQYRAHVTFGVTPEHPSTEYGYVRPGNALSGNIRGVEKFVEKPDAETAAKYVAKGYLWNSGNFLFGAEAPLAEYSKIDAASAEAIIAAVTKAGSELGS
jgi:mannose-1-phosphate guanylyltransferase/mannose-6-phosphate isomerase